MAAKMNMLKLLQEVKGLAQFATRADEPRPTSPLLLQFRGPARRRALRRRYIIKVRMQDPIDIPHPVRITFLENSDAR
jgi:hypothetical protein